MVFPKSWGSVRFRGSRRQLLVGLLLAPVVFVAAPVVFVLILRQFETGGLLHREPERSATVALRPAAAQPSAPGVERFNRDPYRPRVISQNEISTLVQLDRLRSGWAIARFGDQDALLVGEAGVQVWSSATGHARDRFEYGLWSTPTTARLDRDVLIAGLQRPLSRLGAAPEVERPHDLLLIANDRLTSGALTTTRSRYRLAPLWGRQVLVVGGTHDADRTPVREVELVSWNHEGKLKVQRLADTSHAYFRPHLVGLHFNQVMVVGSASPGDATTHAEIYDPLKRTWSAVAPFNEKHFNPIAVATPGGEVVAITATRADQHVARIANVAEVWSPETRTWRVLPGPRQPDREGASAVMLDERRLLLLGGNGHVETEILDLVEGEWSVGPTLAMPHRMASVLVLPSSEILILGGFDSTGQQPTGTLEIVSARATPLPPPRDQLQWRTRDAELTGLADGRVLVSGGWMDSRSSTRHAEIIDPATRRPASIAAMNYERAGHQSFLLADGSVLLVGGERVAHRDRDDPVGRIESERWDPRTGEWSVVPGLDVPEARASIPFLLRANGELVGFEALARPTRSNEWATTAMIQAWQWEENTREKRRLPASTTQRDAFYAFELADGRLGVVGGNAPRDVVALEPECATCPDEYVPFGDAVPSATTEVFDFTTQRWSAGPTAEFPGGAALRLRDGRILKVTTNVFRGPGEPWRLVAELADKTFTRWSSAGSIGIEAETVGSVFQMLEVGNRVAVFTQASNGYRRAFLWSADSGQWSIWPKGDNWSEAVALDEHRLLLVPSTNRYREPTRFEFLEVP